jgi:succinoglycan biosynthesis protein ExoA
MAGASSERMVETPSTQAGVGPLSIMIPMLNEADHIHDLVADIASQDYEGELEVLVADGGSTDGSPELLREAAEAAGIPITILENPERIVSPGLNECIRRATGDFIVRLDCHARYPSDYLRRSVEAALETGAWLVGGRVLPTGRTPIERAVACATDGPFGGAFWKLEGDTTGPVEVDAVSLGIYRVEMFERIGLFDEELVRDQDEELALRIRLAGGRVMYDSRIRCHYVPRGTYSGAFKQYFQYGFWKVPVMLKHRRITSGRSMAPVVFVSSLLALGAAAPWSRTARGLLAAEVAVYAVSGVAFGAISVRARGESPRLLPAVAAVFPTMHVGFGLGFLRGCVEALLVRRPESPSGDSGRAKGQRT